MAYQGTIASGVVIYHRRSLYLAVLVTWLFSDCSKLEAYLYIRYTQCRIRDST